MLTTVLDTLTATALISAGSPRRRTRDSAHECIATPPLIERPRLPLNAPHPCVGALLGPESAMMLGAFPDLFSGSHRPAAASSVFPRSQRHGHRGTGTVRRAPRTHDLTCHSRPGDEACRRGGLTQRSDQRAEATAADPPATAGCNSCCQHRKAQRRTIV